ncbi:unnamed protein product [Phytophthora fragariaefolia]|uniref:Unnamed protein product n=1 Tax=Phytophthora fragariaefolia TaxID=1490495 RepID=A0A9W6Y6J2_9STRA|nr:unnamed protein product [Phytophthora fragariaefolia]
MLHPLSRYDYATVDAVVSGTASPQLEEWAAETTATWTKQVKAEWRQKKRRETLVRFRAHRKQRSDQLRCDRERLEGEVKRRLAALHAASTIQHQIADRAGQSVSVAVCRLALESELLRNDNVEMHQKLQQLKRLWSLVQEGLVEVTGSPTENSGDVCVYKASQTSVWVSARRRENESVWRVYFPNGEPSIYFQPLTRNEFDEIYRTSIDEFMWMSKQENPVGTLFGWTMYKAPLVRNPRDQTLVAQAKFSMRVRFPLEYVDGLVVKADLKWLPLIVVPPGWNENQRDLVSVQVLQEFETDAYIMVCNIPGDTHLRYLQMIRRLPRRLRNGTRIITYSMAIANSPDNDRAREAEGPRPDVSWVNEGSNVLVVTEVDEKTVDLVFEYRAPTQNELHAQHFFIYWAQFVCRWSARIVLPRLIESENTNLR